MLSIIIPVFNEADSLRELHSEIGVTCSAKQIEAEIIFVDDGSTDRTWETVRELTVRDGRVRGIRFRRNFGKAAALSAGMQAAHGELLCMLDADLQDDPSEIPAFLEKIAAGCDVVNGWKKERNDPWHKVFPSRILNRMVSSLTGLALHDHNCGLKCFRREVAEEIRLYGELHRFIPVLAHYRGFRVAELSVNHRPRTHGSSRYGLERYLRGFLDLLTVTFMGRYRHRPLHLFGGLGLILGALGTAVLVYLTVLKATGHAIGQRPLLTLGVLLVVVGLQFFSLGLLSEMVTSHHEERSGAADRERALVDEVLS
jgi:glycosyltransferase involved in cell wall biosynthesis